MATARPGPSTTLSWLWGDGYTPAPRAISYEDGHNAVQDVLIPPSYPKGINVVVLQSTASPHFAIQHR